MTIVPVLAIIGVGLLTVLYQVLIDGCHRLAGPDRAGALIGIPLLLLRWGGLAWLLWTCIGRGGLPWPASRPGQYALVLVGHAVLGVISLLSGLTKAQPNQTPESIANALGLVPFLLPPFELAFVLTVIFPDALEASSLLPIRLGALALAGAVGLPTGVTLGILAIREQREKTARDEAYGREEAAKDQALADAKQKAFDALKGEEPLAAWFPFIGWGHPEPIRTAAKAAILKRPRLGADLAERILATDSQAARVAMYFVGEMDPPPAEVADAVRSLAAEVVRVAESIDPASPGSRNELYDRVHTISTGVTAAAHGLRRARVDLRPELRAMSTTCTPREKDPPHSIADSCNQIIRYFDQLDRESAAKGP